VHPDVSLVAPKGAAGRIGIDQVRAVVDTVPGRPYEASRRVWIFDGVEAGRLGTEAANAFLKTLEEPPEHACFVLLAANPAAVLPTIRSRCQHIVLPGAVAVAAHLGGSDQPPELVTSAVADGDAPELLAQAREALAAARGGEVIHLLRLARAAADVPRAFQAVAAVALEMVGDAGEDGDSTDALVRLAVDLLRTESLTRVLNLNRERQLQACLLRWQAQGGS